MIARPATAAIAKKISATVSTARGLSLARRGEAGGADAVIVGAADAVAVVVRVVDADLQAHRDDEAEQRDHPVEQSVDEHRGARADEDRGDRERQRPQARRADPVAEVAFSMCRGSRDSCAFCGLPRGGCLRGPGCLRFLLGVPATSSHPTCGAGCSCARKPWSWAAAVGREWPHADHRIGRADRGRHHPRRRLLARRPGLRRSARALRGLGDPRPALQGALGCARGEPRAVGHRLPAALPAPHPSRPLRRGSGGRDRSGSSSSARATVDWDDYPDDADWVVLEDTEGNRFCVVDTGPQAAA